MNSVLVSDKHTGLPHPSLFPFESLVVNSYPSSLILDPLAPVVPQKDLESFEISKDGKNEILNLATALQYGQPPSISQKDLKISPI